MKITYIHQYFNTPSMPGSTRSYEMARRLVAKGHHVTMVTSWREGNGFKGWNVTDESGITVHWLHVPYSNNLNFKDRLISFFKFALFSSIRATSLQSEIIFATSTPLTIAIPGVFSSWIRKVPLVFEVRDLWPQIPIAMGVLKHPLLITFARALESWAYRNSSAVVALSPGMKQAIVKSGYSPSRVVVIPNSSDNKEFVCDPESSNQFRSSRPWLCDRPLLIYAGTFGLVNGLGYIVDLAKELLSLGSEIQILLVGDGSELNSILNKARFAGVLQKNFFVEESMAKNQIPILFSAATICSCLFIDLPDMQSNSANKFFDALAAGKPVFLNFGGWMHDLVLEHHCGITGWRRSLQDVARELDQRMHDSEWLDTAGRSAKTIAEENFDRDLLASKLEKVLIAAAEGRVHVSDQSPSIYS